MHLLKRTYLPSVCGPRLYCFTMLLSLAFSFAATESAQAEPMQIVIHDLPADVSAATTSLNPQYIVATPSSADETDALPLLIYLHGGGAGGSDIDKLREELPINYFNTQKDHPFVIVVPQCMPQKKGERAIWEAADLDLLLAQLKKTVAFDESRIYLTGYSMGGYGTWAWASSSPQHFAAIVPHAGGLGTGGPKDVTPNLDQWAGRLAALPIWIFHGADDKVVPAERSERMFKLLQSKGASRVKLTILPDKGHAIGGNYWNREMYDWLLRHSRSGDQIIVSDAKTDEANAPSKPPEKATAERNSYPFRMNNLIPWSIAAFDSKQRTPAERVEMVAKLGFSKLAFGGKFDGPAKMKQEWRIARESGVQIDSVWLYLNRKKDQPGKLKPESEALFQALKDEGLKTQVWVGFGPEYFTGLDDAAALEHAKTMVKSLCERAKAIGCKIALYNHGGWLGEPENQVKVIESLPNHEIGIIYNFHHAHLQLDRYPQLLDPILPYLWCVNLNGMKKDGPKIITIGEGDLEKQMIGALLKKGFKGPFGILGHIKTEDAETVLQRNITGLHSLFPPMKSRFPFVIPGDDGLKGTATDMSPLSPKPAGADGFTRVHDGHFYTDTQRLKIWGVNVCFGANFPEKQNAEKIAAHLAKLGINGVRFHHHDMQDAPRGIWKKGLVDGKRVFDPEMVDRLDFFLAKLHEHGIYANLNLHCSRSLTIQEGYPPHDDQWRTSHNKYTMYFDPGIRDALRQFCRDYLLHISPYRRLRRVDDPGIAMLELTNENAFSQLGPGIADQLPEPYRGRFKQQWNQWLKDTYGTDEALRKAWSESKVPLEAPMATSDAWRKNAGKWSSHGLQATFGQPGPNEKTPAVKLKFSEVSKDSWEQQITLQNIAIKEDQLYTLRFWYRAEQPRSFSVDVAGLKPWKDLGLMATAKASTQWQEFKSVFSGKETLDKDTRLGFSFGGEEGDIWLAGVLLLPGDRLEALPEGQSLLKGNVEIPNSSGWSSQAIEAATRFMQETEVAYHRDMKQFLKEELSVRVPISPTQINYITPALAHKIDADFADLHAYWQHPLFPGKQWDRENWFIRNKPIEAYPFQDNWPGNSILARAGWRQLGKPFTFSEWNSGEPMIYGAGLIPTSATVAALQDWDAVFFFQYDESNSDPFRDHFNSYFSINAQPAKLAMLTASANLFRRGDLPPLTSEIAIPLGENLPHSSLGLSHRVGMRAGVKTIPTDSVPDQTRLASPGNQVVWDTTRLGHEHIVLNTPVTRGVWGRVAGETFDLGGCTIVVGQCENDYACILLTSLDGKPLESSKRMLLTAVGSAENTDMQWNGDKTSVGRNWGKGPTLINGIPFTIRFADGNHEIYALDGKGQRTAKTGNELSGKYQTLWYEVLGQ